MQRHFTLTSSAGRFVFPKGTILSHAKVVRDALTAGSRGMVPHTSIPNPDNAQRWFKDHVAGPIGHGNGILFEWLR